MRADKLTLAVLQSVAIAYLSGDATAIPLWRMATASVDALAGAGRSRRRATVPGAKVIEHRGRRGRRVAPGSHDPVGRRSRVEVRDAAAIARRPA